MIERSIHHVRVERPPEAETAAEARERLREKFPRASLRRMTHLGMLVGVAVEGVGFARDDVIVYASSFAETRALEDFLSSFPAPSPLLFQTSIHPGAVQQVLIGRQQPVGAFWPLAGRSRMVEQALLTALLEPAERVFVVGGEEKGSWLLDQKMASDRAFAFALELRHEAAGATGSVSLEPAGAGAPADRLPTLAELADAVAERRPLTWSGDHGRWAIAWR